MIASWVTPVRVVVAAQTAASVSPEGSAASVTLLSEIRQMTSLPTRPGWASLAGKWLGEWTHDSKGAEA